MCLNSANGFKIGFYYFTFEQHHSGERPLYRPHRRAPTRHLSSCSAPIPVPRWTWRSASRSTSNCSPSRSTSRLTRRLRRFRHSRRRQTPTPRPMPSKCRSLPSPTRESIRRRWAARWPLPSRWTSRRGTANGPSCSTRPSRADPTKSSTSSAKVLIEL